MNLELSEGVRDGLDAPEELASVMDPDAPDAPVAPRYRELLLELAELDGLSAVSLLDDEALQMGERRIGMLCDGDEFDGDLVLFCSLGQPIEERQSSIDRLLLQANHLGAGTAGCTLGRQGVTNDITLCARLPIPLTSAIALSGTIRAFNSMADLWHDEIRRVSGSAVRDVG